MKIKGEILALISPELRSQLNSIIAHADILDAEIYGPLTVQQHQSLRSIIGSSQNLSGLIDDLLLYSKVEEGKFHPQSSPVWLADFCQNSVRLAREGAYKRCVNLKTEYDNLVEGMVTDEGILKRILVKLLNHAIDRTPEGGNVTLIVKGNRSGETIQFSIQNHWSGTSTDDPGHPSESFTRLEDDNNNLDLTLISRLVELQDGTIDVDRQSAGGSTITVTLPWVLPQKKSRPG